MLRRKSTVYAVRVQLIGYEAHSPEQVSLHRTRSGAEASAKFYTDLRFGRSGTDPVYSATIREVKLES